MANQFNMDDIAKFEQGVELIEELGSTVTKGAECYTVVAEASETGKMIEAAKNQQEAVDVFVSVVKEWAQSAQDVVGHYKRLDAAVN